MPVPFVEQAFELLDVSRESILHYSDLFLDVVLL